MASSGLLCSSFKTERLLSFDKTVHVAAANMIYKAAGASCFLSQIKTWLKMKQKQS